MPLPIIDENTTSDVLEQHFNDANIKNSEGEFNNRKITEILQHPNASPEFLKKAYQSIKATLKKPIDETDEDSIYRSISSIRHIPSIFEHKNANTDDAEDFLENFTPDEIEGLIKKNPFRKPWEDSNDVFDAAIGVKNVSQQKIDNAIKRTIDDPKATLMLEGLNRRSSPELIKNYLQQAEPYKDVSDERNNAFNLKRSKIDSLIHSYTEEKNDHVNDDSINDIAEMALKLKDYHPYDDKYDVKKISGLHGVFYPQLLKNLASNKKSLSTQNLNKLNELIDSEEDRDPSFRYKAEKIRELILDHKNVDPALIAKAANESNQDGKYSNFRSQILRSGLLPEETRKSIFNTALAEATGPSYSQQAVWDLKDLLKNPNTSKEDVDKMAENYKTDSAIRSIGFDIAKHPKLTSEKQLDLWNKQKTNTHDLTLSNNYLDNSSLHEDILKDLVGHKNIDLAVRALEHPSVNINVVNKALKRRSPRVVEAAEKHPLVKENVIKQKILDSNFFATDLIDNQDYKNIFNSFSPDSKKEIITKLNNKFNPEAINQAFNRNNINGLNHEILRNFDGKYNQFYKTKEWLATSPEVPEEIRQQNKHQLIKLFDIDSYQTGNSTEPSSTDSYMFNAALSFINNGDSDFQDHVLNKPAFVSLLDSRLMPKIENSAFIEKAWNKIKSLDGHELLDSRGIPITIKANSFKKEIILNPKTPDNVFDEIALNQQFLEKANNIYLDARVGAPNSNLGSFKTSFYHYKDENGNFKNQAANTIFDKRVGENNFSEQETREMYEKVSNLNENSEYTANSLLMSLTCPKDIKRKAWLNNPNKEKFLAELLVGFELNRSDSFFENLLDKETLEEIAIGKHNLQISKSTLDKINPYGTNHLIDKNEKTNNSLLQISVLGMLNHTNPNHVNIYKKAIEEYIKNPKFNLRYILDLDNLEKFYPYLDIKNLYSQPDSITPATIDLVCQANLNKVWANRDLNKLEQHYSKVKKTFNNIKESIAKHHENEPQLVEEKFANFVQSLFSLAKEDNNPSFSYEVKQTLHKMVAEYNFKTAPDALDFLADISYPELLSDPEYTSDANRFLKLTLANSGFLSTKKSSELLLKYASLLDTLKAKTTQKDFAETFFSILDTNPEKIDKDIFEYTVNTLSRRSGLGLNIESLNPEGKSYKNPTEKEQALNFFNERFKKLFDKAEQFDKDQESDYKTQQILKILDQEPSYRYSVKRVTPNAAERKTILNNLIKHIVEKKPDPKEANKSLLTIYKTLKNANHKLITPTFISNIAKNALKLNDVKTLAEIAVLPDAPASAINGVSKLLNNIESFSLQDATNFLPILDSSKIKIETTKKIVNAVMSKIQSEPNPSDQTVAKLKLIKIMSEAPSKPTEIEKQETNKFYVSNLLNFSRDSDAQVSINANDNLRRNLFNQKYSDDLLKKIYTSLPSDASSFGPDSEKILEKHLNFDRVRENYSKLLNDPLIVESSQTGWKLKTLAKKCDLLKQENQKIIIDRVIEQSNLTKNPEHVYDVASGLATSVSVTPEDYKKIGNVLENLSGNSSFTHVINDISTTARNKGKDQLANNAIYLLDKQNSKFDDSLEKIKTISDKENFVSNLLATAEDFNVTANAIFNKAIFGTEGELAPNGAEKLEICNNFINKLNSFLSEKNQLIQKFYDPENNEIMHSNGSNLSIKWYSSKEHSDFKIKIQNAIAGIISSNLPLTKESSDSLLNIIDYSRHLNFPENKLTASYRIGNYLNFWSQQTAYSKMEEWKNAFEKIPELVFTLNNKDIISSDIVDAIDLDKMEKLIDKNEEDGNLIPYTHSVIFDDLISKMDSIALNKYKKTFLNKAIEHIKDFNTWSGENWSLAYKKQEKEAFSQLLKTMFKYTPDVFDKETFNNCIDSVNDDQKIELRSEAIKNGVGGEELFNEITSGTINDFLPLLKEADKTKTTSFQFRKSADQLKPILQSEKISKNVSETLINYIDNYFRGMVEPIKILAENKYIPENLAATISNKLVKLINQEDEFVKSNDASVIARHILDNPKIPQSDFIELANAVEKHGQYDRVFNPGARFNPALLNPRYGGVLFRSRPVYDPEVENVEKDKLIQTVDSLPTGDFLKKKEKLHDAMLKIKPEGMSWAEAKKAFPDFEKVKEIKNIFMAKQNKPVLPEDIAKAINELEKEKKQNQFFLTYAKWDRKLQVHNDNNNLILQLNCSEQVEKELTQDVKMWAMYQFIMKQANKITGETIGLHPTTPQLVSWSRIDTTSGQEGWIIEELQSDVAQQFRKRVRQMLQASPSMLKISGYNITPEEAKEYIKKIEKTLEGHHNAAIEAVKKIAIQHGVKKLYMHGYQVRSYMSGGTAYASYNRDYVSPAIKKIYGEDPAVSGFSKCKYTDYPNWSNITLKRTEDLFDESPCWVMDLTPKT